MLICPLLFFVFAQIIFSSFSGPQTISTKPILDARANVHHSCYGRVASIQIVLEQIMRVARAAMWGAIETNEHAFDRAVFRRYFLIDNAQNRAVVLQRFSKIYNAAAHTEDQMLLRCDDPSRLCVRRPRMNVYAIRTTVVGPPEIALCRRFFTKLDFLVAAPRLGDDQVFVLLREFTRAGGVLENPLTDFKELGFDRYNPQQLWPQQAIESSHMYETYAKTLWLRLDLEEDEMDEGRRY